MSNPTRELESKWEKQSHRQTLEPDWKERQHDKIWGDIAPDEYEVCWGCNWAWPPGVKKWITAQRGDTARFCDDACVDEYELDCAIRLEDAERKIEAMDLRYD